MEKFSASSPGLLTSPASKGLPSKAERAWRRAHIKAISRHIAIATSHKAEEEITARYQK